MNAAAIDTTRHDNELVRWASMKGTRAAMVYSCYKAWLTSLLIIHARTKTVNLNRHQKNKNSRQHYLWLPKTKRIKSTNKRQYNENKIIIDYKILTYTALDQ